MRGCTCKEFFAVFGLIGVIVLLVPLHARAQEQQKKGSVGQNEVFSEESFRDWLKGVREEAGKKGISKNTLDAALHDVKPVRRVIELDRSQPEFTQTFLTYLGRRVTEGRVIRGRSQLEKHRELLENIRNKYGVPPRYIISFWGLETNFGDYLGSFRVINSLATLAFDQRRADFFRAQLFEALEILEEGHIAPEKMIGSWAGAMGHVQFLPSTFTGYAVDYTGEGRKDIWESLPDAFASAANFLSSLGWNPDEKWGRQVRLPRDFDTSHATLKQKKTIEQWSKLGVRRADGTALPSADMKGSVVMPQGREGPGFLVYDNFRVIMRWNRSVKYAISVGHLADRIIGLPAMSAVE